MLEPMNESSMSASRVRVLAVLAAALLFAAIGVEFWVVPEQAAHRFGLDAVRAAGVSALRADLGGLFVGLAVLCGAAFWMGRRTWLLAAAALLSVIVIGRCLGWMTAGPAAGELAELAVELGSITALLACARGTEAQSERKTKPWRGRSWAIAGAVLLVAVMGAGAALLTPGVQQRIFDRAALEMTARTNTAPLADDALRVAICGSSAPLPSARRAKACVVVFAGGKFYVVDAGPESVENLVLSGVPLSAVGGVLLTHFHSDHIGDLGELNLQTWAGGRKAPLDVYGGPGVEEVVEGFNRAYAQDQGHRTAHHGENVMPSAAWRMIPHPVDLDGPPMPAKDRTGLVLEVGALRITAIEVDHAPVAPAYAYRFDYKGRSVVITGDLKNHPPLAKAAAGADVLVSEAIAKTMTRALQNAAISVGRTRTAAIMHDIEDYHITPEEAARIANDAGVKLLVFYHLLPAPDGFLPRRLFTHGVSAVRRGDWTMADDGSMYTLPLGSKDVRVGRLTD